MDLRTGGIFDAKFYCRHALNILLIMVPVQINSCTGIFFLSIFAVKIKSVTFSQSFAGIIRFSICWLQFIVDVGVVSGVISADGR